MVNVIRAAELAGTDTEREYGSGTVTAAGPMSYEQFLAWRDRAGHDERAEWVEGRVTLLSLPTHAHQAIAGFLFSLLNLFVLRAGLGEVLFMGFQLKLEHSGREPDILFISSARRAALTRTHLQGPADLVVEIVSPDSVTRDRRDKLAEYEAAGVPEYWIVDPDRHEALFFALGADGRYAPLSVDGGVVHSCVLPEFRLQVAWLWQEPLPTLAAGAELGLWSA